MAGRHYSELAASWLWVLTLGGIVLWWRRRRNVRKMFAPDLSAKKGVRRTRGWHASTGVWIAVGLLLLSATGLTWSRYAGGNFTLALDALSVARDAGMTGRIELTPPKDATSAWTVAGIDNTWPVHLDRIAVDPTTSAVVARSDFADWPLLAQLSKLGVQAHMGILFGIVNQLLLAALAIGLICVIVWGYRMWWQRRPTRADRRALTGTAPARGGWLRLPAWAITIGVPVVVAIGWALPLFGMPLAAFLLVDVIIGAFRSRRPTAAPTSPAPAGR